MYAAEWAGTNAVFKTFNLQTDIFKCGLLVLHQTMMLSNSKRHQVLCACEGTFYNEWKNKPKKNNPKTPPPKKIKKSPDNIRESPDYRIGIMGTIQSSISELDAYLWLLVEISPPVFLLRGTVSEYKDEPLRLMIWHLSYSQKEKEKLCLWEIRGGGAPLFSPW